MGNAGRMRNGVVRVLPAIGLFFLAPIVAEYLLGDFPITMIGPMVIMAPMYGGGAILIREAARRTGRGWPTILTLALAYGVVEEAFTTQSLFNPDYLGLHLHLLDHAFIPALGIGAWWTVFVLTLHTVWSISTPIALVEALVPARAGKPWLGRFGLGAVSVLFALAAVVSTRFSIRSDRHHFVASREQFAVSAIACVVLGVVAFLLPRRVQPGERGEAPSAWMTGAVALAAGSMFLLVPPMWGWGAVAVYAAMDATLVSLVAGWSRRRNWGLRHMLALAGGAALAYAWHAFLQPPVMGRNHMVAMRVGNTVLALGVVALLMAASSRITAARAASESMLSDSMP